MSQNTGSLHDEITAFTSFVTDANALNSHVVNRSLDRLLHVLSSEETGDKELDQTLGSIRHELDSLLLAQGKEEQEIKSLVQSVLDREVVEHVEREIQKRVDRSIDQMIPQLVESYLDEYVPRSLREGIDKNRDELNAIQSQLHNEDSRRQNVGIKTIKHLGEALCHLLNEKGERSNLFPQNVSGLLGLNDGDLSKLVKFYGMGQAGKKVDNINWFLEFSGVQFRCVRT